MCTIFRRLRRLDDLHFIETLFDKCVSIVIVPHKDLLVAWCREDVSGERIFEKKMLRNRLILIKARLSLHVEEKPYVIENV